MSTYSVKTYLSRQENPFLEKTFDSEIEALLFFEKESKKTKFKGRRVWGVVLGNADNVLKVAYSLVLPSTVSRRKQFNAEMKSILENIEHRAFIDLRYPSNRDLGFSLDEVKRTLAKLDIFKQVISTEYTSENQIDIDKISEQILSKNLKNEFFEFKNSRYSTTLIIDTKF